MDDSMKLRSVDELCKQLPEDLTFINQWTYDQVILIQNFIKDREKILQLNLKIN